MKLYLLNFVFVVEADKDLISKMKNVMQLLCSESTEVFHKAVKDGIDEYNGVLADLDAKIQLSCTEETVRATHRSRNSPKYEKHKAECMKELKRRVPECVLSRTDVFLPNGQTTETDITKAEMEVVKGRLQTVSGRTFIRDYAWIKHGVSRPGPSPDIDIPSSPLEIPVQESSYTDRDCQVVDVSSWVHQSKFDGEVSKTTVISYFLSRMHEQALYAKDDVCFGWDDSSLLERDAVKMGTEWDRYVI